MNRLRSVFAAAVVMYFAVGCATNKPVQHRVATSAPVATGKPIIDFGHGSAGFPLVNKEKIDSRQHLLDELTAGYAERVQMPTTKPTVRIAGDFPHMQSLVIDLSGGEIKSAYRPTSLKGVDKHTIVAHVDELKYIADPVSYDNAAQHLVIDASDVTLSLLHGKGEKEVLVMSDVGSGDAHFDAKIEDLNTLLLAASREHAGSSGFFVTTTKLHMTSANPHSLAASLEVNGFFLVIPTSITISGQIDIDDDFQATLSHLKCKGGAVGGGIAAAFINDRLTKYEGKRQPLTAFPGSKMRLRDVHIAVDDSLHVNAEFGR